MMAPTIDARAVWFGDGRECRRLYCQFTGYFRGRFKSMCAYYGWKPAAMLRALRLGRFD